MLKKINGRIEEEYTNHNITTCKSCGFIFEAKYYTTQDNQILAICPRCGHLNYQQKRKSNTRGKRYGSKKILHNKKRNRNTHR